MLDLVDELECIPVLRAGQNAATQAMISVDVASRGKYHQDKGSTRMRAQRMAIITINDAVLRLDAGASWRPMSPEMAITISEAMMRHDGIISPTLAPILMPK